MKQELVKVCGECDTVSSRQWCPKCFPNGYVKHYQIHGNARARKYCAKQVHGPRVHFKRVMLDDD